jgi:DNA-3-methyladenine glycosylase II
MQTLKSPQATRHIYRRDRNLRFVIDSIGEFKVKLERNPFRMLVRSILSQQLSSSAATTIQNRLLAMLVDRKFDANSVAALGVERIKSAGVSRQKAQHIYNLAENVLAGRLPSKALSRMSDEEVISTLTEIKGVGRWTAQMYLIFSLGRLNVFPDNDAAVRSAMRKI